MARLGGGADLETATLETRLGEDLELDPLPRGHELVVPLCCVGETLSNSR